MSHRFFRAALMIATALSAAPAFAQDVPAPYREVLTGAANTLATFFKAAVDVSPGGTAALAGQSTEARSDA